MGISVYGGTDKKKIREDERITDNTELEGKLIEVEGVCRGVCIKETSDCAEYRGILHRANGEIILFSGYSSLESTIAKTSSETSTNVLMQCRLNKDNLGRYNLYVEGLGLTFVSGWITSLIY